MGEMLKKIDVYAAENPWKFALWLMPIGIPLALWSGWEAISAVQNTLVRVLLTIGIVIATYIGAGLLFWFHGWAQGKWRKYGVIND